MRRAAFAAAVVLVGLVAACGARSEAARADLAPETGGEEGAARAYSADHRLAPLLAPCSTLQYYDRDLGDLMPVLMEKLRKGYTEPLQRSKEELANLGDVAMIEVRRLSDRYFNDPEGASYVQNALDVAVISRAPLAREVLLRFLDHPREDLRRAALRGLLAHHVRPEDFDRLWIQLEAENAVVAQLVSACMHAADPARAEALFLGWIDVGSYNQLWQHIMPILASSELPATARAAADLAPELPPVVRPYLAACAARSGDQASLELLREELVAEEPQRRERAVHAAALARLDDVLSFALSNDPHGSVRRVAVGAVSAMEAGATRDAQLLEAIGDEDGEVRLIALTALVERGNGDATDRALAMLGGTDSDLQTALLALRARLNVDSALAVRAFERLKGLHEDELHLPLSERRRLLKAIGVVPTRAAAEYLRRVALEEKDEDISSLRTHELLMIHASNTGEVGRQFLFEELENERDPQRRIDLLYAASAHRTDGARRRLHEFLQREDVSAYEVLYAADLLARLGPAQDVAPMLKRICYRTTQEDVRLALRCLMWRWY